MVEKALAATAVVYANHLKSAAGSCRVGFPQLVNAEKSGNDYSQELPRFNRKRYSIVKPEPLQPKPVAVETVDPNRTRPKFFSREPRLDVCVYVPSQIHRQMCGKFKKLTERLLAKLHPSNLVNAIFYLVF